MLCKTKVCLASAPGPQLQNLRTLHNVLVIAPLLSLLTKMFKCWQLCKWFWLCHLKMSSYKPGMCCPLIVKKVLYYQFYHEFQMIKDYLLLRKAWNHGVISIFLNHCFIVPPIISVWTVMWFSLCHLYFSLCFICDHFSPLLSFLLHE